MRLHPLFIGALKVDPPVIMAPMAGFTDGIFRGLLREFGGCGLLFTEMVSAEGLLRGNRGTFDLLPPPEEQSDTAVQLFGSQPGRVAEAAAELEGMGVRLVDINMGCPARKVVAEGAGAALLREPARAAALVEAVKKKSASR